MQNAYICRSFGFDLSILVLGFLDFSAIALALQHFKHCLQISEPRMRRDT